MNSFDSAHEVDGPMPTKIESRVNLETHSYIRAEVVASYFNWKVLQYRFPLELFDAPF